MDALARMHEERRALRKALGEDRMDARFILTVPDRGYQFLGRVEVLP